MEISKALATAMAANGMRDEHVAVASDYSVAQVRKIRLGHVKNPRNSTISALKRVVPGLEDLLEKRAVA